MPSVTMGTIEDVYEDLDADVSEAEFREAVEEKIEQMGGLADVDDTAPLRHRPAMALPLGEVLAGRPAVLHREHGPLRRIDGQERLVVGLTDPLGEGGRQHQHVRRPREVGTRRVLDELADALARRHRGIVTTTTQ